YQLGSTSATTTADIASTGLTVSGVTANNKVYDGTTTATLNLGSAALVGVLSGDVVTLNTSSAAGAFADENVGTGKAVMVSGLSLSGADAANYMLTQPDTMASITTHGLTVTGITANNKVYDGTTTATLNPQLSGQRRRSHARNRQRDGHFRRRERGHGQGGYGQRAEPRRRRRRQLCAGSAEHDGGHHRGNRNGEHHLGQQDLRRDDRGNHRHPHPQRCGGQRRRQPGGRHGELCRQER